MEINFKWDMIDKEFKALMAPVSDEMAELSEYDGAVFFGDYKLEFCHNTVAGAFCNLFQYGADGYEYLANGVPYAELDDMEYEIIVPYRRLFESFAINVERQIVAMLYAHPVMIKSAVGETNPDKWYPEGQLYTIDDISRDIREEI